MTSDLLNKVFPLVRVYFDEKGVSATVANAKKNDNTNDNNYLMKDLQSAELYDMHITIVSDKGVTERVVGVQKLQISDFDKLKTVIENKGENALLGNGIKIFNKAIETIRNYDVNKLVELNGGEPMKPFDHNHPPRDYAIQNGDIDTALNMERMEDMLEQCTAEGLEKLDAAMIKNALRLESEAATLGIELTKKDSFLRKLLEAKANLEMTETVANFAVVIKQPKLAYTPDEIAAFKTLFEALQVKYKNLQGQLNGIKKTIKDAIRMADIEFAKKYELDSQQYQETYRIWQEKVNQNANQGAVLKQKLIQELLALKIQTE